MVKKTQNPLPQTNVQAAKGREEAFVVGGGHLDNLNQPEEPLEENNKENPNNEDNHDGYYEDGREGGYDVEEEDTVNPNDQDDHENMEEDLPKDPEVMQLRQKVLDQEAKMVEQKEATPNARDIDPASSPHCIKRS
ncbi:hypothetical protein CsatA_026008 [Cannabis sativa]